MAKEKNKETIRNRAGIEQVSYDNRPPAPPQKPGLSGRLFDKALRTFGARDKGNEDEAATLRSANYDVNMKTFGWHALSQDALVCGDPKELENMVNEEYRTPVEKAVLGFRRDTANKVEALGRNAQRPVCPETRKVGDNVYLPDARQPTPQSTTNGCWSVSMESLLAYHGVNLTQQEIRAYRPDCSVDPTRNMTVKEQENERNLLSRRMNANAINDICDYSDLIHTTMQDVALHHVSPSLEHGTDELKQYIRMGLEQHKSPISICFNGHFQTVVGLEGDKLLLLDPHEKYPEVNGKIQPTKVKLSSLHVDDHGVTLDWIEKLDDKTKDAAIDSIKGVENKETFSRRKGFTKAVYDAKTASEHHVVYPKAYEQEALRRVKEDAEKAKAPEQKDAPERQSGEPGLSRKEAEIKFRDVKKAFQETKNEIEKDKQARQAKEKAWAAKRENSARMVTEKGKEKLEALVQSTREKQATGVTTAPKTVSRAVPEKAQESPEKVAMHQPVAKAKESGMSK
ncbi:MAG: hypothetical protein RR295_03150 [Oscillospiraceae bacterium]